MLAEVVDDAGLDHVGGRVGPHADVGALVHPQDLGPGDGPEHPLGVLRGTSVSTVPWTSNVAADRTERRVDIGKAALVVLQAGAPPESVALSARTKSRLASCAQMCSVSSLASVLDSLRPPP